MKESANGWDAWYAQWDETYSDAYSDDEFAPNVISYPTLSTWGELFRERVMLNDHWMGYMHPEPMSLEDGMSIAFVLYDAGVNVDDLLDLLESFEPFEGAPLDFGIPLCWLTEPMDHVQDLLGMLADVSSMEPEVFDQMQQMLSETLGEEPLVSTEDLPELFSAMLTSTAQWLMEIIRLLGDDGMLALRAWWQGRLITLLREASKPRRKKSRRSLQRSAPERSEIPSAFRDLIQGLDFRGLGADASDAEDADK